MKKIFFYRYKICNLFKYPPSGRARKENNNTGGNSTVVIYAITENNGAICGVFAFPDAEHGRNNIGKNVGDAIIGETPLIKNAANQIEEYFKKKRKMFDLPLKPSGTEFQLKVWKELLCIPYGETRSYGKIAEAIGNQKASRAVGMANNKNPIHIIIPCHRVIGSDGSLAGYADGLEIKNLLLELERG